MQSPSASPPPPVPAESVSARPAPPVPAWLAEAVLIIQAEPCLRKPAPDAEPAVYVYPH
jgi:hypothetical protein